VAEETHDATPTEAMQISMAAAEAAKDAGSSEEAQQQVTQAVEEKARELKVTLDPQAAKAVGREVIVQLEAMGAFREPEVEHEPEPVAVTPAQPAVEANPEPAPKKNWIQRLVSDD